jgi:hypothetical protein
VSREVRCHHSRRGVATPPERTIVVATNDVNRTPSPQTSSADRHLKRFTERVTKARQLPLLELPEDVAALGRCAPSSLPKRSRRIAAQAVAHIPTAKRGEYLFMKRLGHSIWMPPPSMPAMMYDEVFNGDPAHMQALCKLFPSVGDVGTRKRRCSPAARA